MGYKIQWLTTTDHSTTKLVVVVVVVVEVEEQKQKKKNKKIKKTPELFQTRQIHVQHFFKY